MIDSCGCTIEEGNPSAQKTGGVSSSEVARRTCPVCGLTGKKVAGQTVKAMLAVSLREIVKDDFRFCPNEKCEVVYFSTDGRQRFTRSQIREKVYQKELLAEDAFVCYCFRHTRGEIRNATPEDQARIVAEINAGVQAGQCACDLRNPQGSCCLGNIHQLIKQIS